MTIQEQLQYYQNEAITIRNKANAARKKYWLIILAVAIVFGGLALYGWLGKRKPLPPVVKTTTEYIYLDTAAARQLRRADSLQIVADNARDSAAAAIKVSNYYKSQIHDVETVITDIRNGAVAAGMSTEAIADYLLRYLGYIK